MAEVVLSYVREVDANAEVDTSSAAAVAADTHHVRDLDAVGKKNPPAVVGEDTAAADAAVGVDAEVLDDENCLLYHRCCPDDVG